MKYQPKYCFLCSEQILFNSLTRIVIQVKKMIKRRLNEPKKYLMDKLTREKK